MSSIHETAQGTWRVSFREGRKQRTVTKKTKGEAQTYQADIDRRMTEGKPIVRRSDAPTLGDFAKDWLASRTDLAESTQIRYAECLSTHILPSLGHLSLVDLRPRRLAQWQEERLAAGAGPANLGKSQMILSQICDRAVLPHEYIDANPVLALKRPKYEKKAHRWLTAGEVESLRMWFLERGDVGSATLISVLAYVGIRPQDALALSWSDLSERLSVMKKNVDGKILSGSKTGEGYKRTVYIPGPVMKDLEEWRVVRPGGLIFPRTDGQPWTKTDYANWRSRHPKDGKRPRCFRAAAEAADLGESLTPYALRHTGASLLAACGWGAVEIAHQLGHKATESQRTYQHILVLDPGPRKTIEDYICEARGIAPPAKKEPAVA